MNLYWYLHHILMQRWFLWILFVVNFMGTIYGFYWYKEQLADTFPPFLRIFVPDSPTGSGLFTLVLLAYLMGKKLPALEAVASVTNFKYGTWAVIIIIVDGFMGNRISMSDVMLMISHTGMALESLLYKRYYSYGFFHIMLAAGWILLNDLFDYTLDIHPWFSNEMETYAYVFGYFTVFLSIFSLFIFTQGKLRPIQKGKNLV